MELFRWILVLTGIVLLAIAFFMGRQKKVGSTVYSRAVPEAYDPSLDELSVPISDLNDDAALDRDWDRAPSVGSRTHFEDNRSFSSDNALESPIAANDTDPMQVELAISDEFDHEDHSNYTRPVEQKSFASAVKAAAMVENETVDTGSRDFSEELQPYSEDPVQLESFEEKLVTVHVAALRDRRFNGADLKSVFDQHGYEFGRMSLYHCSLDGDKVFSIANMVKPGTFDAGDLEGFETPGITLFMRLPIELDADVAFDFLIREASELAEQLDGQLRDDNRNPLSEQTIQHMREDIQQYVFRTKRTLHPTT